MSTPTTVTLASPKENNALESVLCKIISGKIRSHADFDKKRGFADKCDLTIKSIVAMLRKQPNCAICNDPMVQCVGKKCGWQWSIDRINNNLGHIISNVRLTCYYCNVRQYGSEPTFEEASLMKRTKTCKAGCHVATVSRADTRLMHIALKLKRAFVKRMPSSFIADKKAIIIAPPSKDDGHQMQPLTTDKEIGPTQATPKKLRKKRGTQQGTYNCPNCSYSTKLAKDLERHMSRKNTCGIRPSPPTTVDPNFTCPHCNKVLSSKRNAIEHSKRCKFAPVNPPPVRPQDSHARLLAMQECQRRLVEYSATLEKQRRELDILEELMDRHLNDN
jgi:hypothetical protein